MYFSERFFVFENIWNQGFVKDVHKLTLTLLPGCTKLLLQTAFMDNLVFILKAHSTWKLKCANLHWQLSSKNNLKLWFSWILCYESKLFQHESTTGHFRARERARERERERERESRNIKACVSFHWLLSAMQNIQTWLSPCGIPIYVANNISSNLLLNLSTKPTIYKTIHEHLKLGNFIQFWQKLDFHFQIETVKY